jgi:putative DNA primase/helicase
MFQDGNSDLSSQAKTLLEYLWRGGQWALYWTSEGKKSYWHSLKDIDFPGPPNLPKRNIFFSVNPGGNVGDTPSDMKRIKSDQIQAVNCLYADFDEKDYGSKAEIQKHLGTLSAPPTAVVDSGGGFHCYWIFSDTYRIDTPEDKQLITQLQADWVQLVGGDKGAKDLARVLRVPGTLNHKYDPPRPVVLEVLNDSNLAAFDEYLVYVKAENKPSKQSKQAEKPATQRSQGTQGKTHTLPPNPEKWLTEALRMGTVRNRNKTCYWLAQQLWWSCDLTESEAEPWVLSYWESVEQPHGDLYTKAEAMASLRSAYSGEKRDPAESQTKQTVNYTGGGGKTSTSKTPDTTPTPATVAKVKEPKNRLTDRHAAWDLYDQTTDLQWTKDFGWMGWSGSRWQGDATSTAIKETAGIAEQYLEAGYALDEKEHKEEKKAYLKYASRLDSKAGVEGCLHFARGFLEIDANKFDRLPFKLNLINGTLDLKTGKLHPHRREDLLTQRANVSFDPDATAPRWESFLLEIMGKDREVINFLQRMIGYAFTGDVREQVLFFLHGSGANGKSVFLNVIRRLLGDYVITPKNTLLTMGEHHATQIADLRGKRLVPAIENELGARLPESLVKQLTGGDEISANRMHEDSKQFEPTHKIFVAANHKPIIRGTDHAIWRRIKLIPFEVTFLEDEQDPLLEKKLFDELPGILNWAVAGCQAWLRNGMQYPEKVNMATQEYRTDSDQLGKFIVECCIVRPATDEIPAEEIRAGVLFAAFSKWCEPRNERPGTLTSFGNRMTERGFERNRKGGVHYIGIELKEEVLWAKDSTYAEGGF